MKSYSENKEILAESTDYQAELNEIFNEALKDIDSELIETLDFVSKLTFDETQMFQITNSQSGTIKENNIYAE